MSLVDGRFSGGSHNVEHASYTQEIFGADGFGIVMSFRRVDMVFAAKVEILSAPGHFVAYPPAQPLSTTQPGCSFF